MENKKKYLFDFHIHSNHSDGINTPAEIVSRAKKMGLCGIAITDHNEIDGSLEALLLADEDFIVIPGMEVSSSEGHILALGVKRIIKKEMSPKETVDAIHKAGGLVIAAHPYDLLRGGVGDLVLCLPFDAVEIENGHSLYTYKKPLHVAKINNLPIAGGSDAHCLDEIGRVVISVPEKYRINPLKAIKEREVEVISNAKKRRILKYFVIRRCKKLFR